VIVFGAAQLFSIANLVWSLARGRRTGDNPWRATTLEWTTSSPPPVHNFLVAPEVHRGPYDYSAPGAAEDFVAQSDGAGR
jgi:cytochrome c oxidase subunit I